MTRDMYTPSSTYKTIWNAFRKCYFSDVLYFPPEHEPNAKSMGYVSYVMDKYSKKWIDATWMWNEDYTQMWASFYRQYGEGLIYPDENLEGEPEGTVKELMRKFASRWKE